MEMEKCDDVEVMRRFKGLRMKLLDILERRDMIGSSLTGVEAKIEINLFWLNVDKETLRNLRNGENVKHKTDDEFKSWNCISEIQVSQSKQENNYEILKLDTLKEASLKEKPNCEEILEDSNMWWDEMDN
ncbi:GH16768 [Drosophila grimshawi]|uniref:GH16768 n=1 Tax=Drosophila grimshawi TaxID=7222 RepID=B4J3R0_DROGR|nr:GH16768 [Drosophila grimshawi]